MFLTMITFICILLFKLLYLDLHTKIHPSINLDQFFPVTKTSEIVTSVTLPSSFPLSIVLFSNLPDWTTIGELGNSSDLLIMAKHTGIKVTTYINWNYRLSPSDYMTSKLTDIVVIVILKIH